MSLTPILPGDILVITSPRASFRPKTTYSLPPGEYRLVVKRSLAAKLGSRFKVLVADYHRYRTLTVYLSDSPCFNDRYLFMGRDKYPVEYTHIPNLETRILLSLPKEHDRHESKT